MFRIAQISDTHLSAAKPFFIGNFRRITEAIAAAGCDLLLNSGDISLDGADSEADLAASRRLHDAAGLVARRIPGNHDLGDNQELGPNGHPVIDARRRERYLRHFGPDWWSRDVPGWRLLGVNAQLIGSDLEAAAAQEAFIASAVADLGSRALALFTHKPLFDAAPDETLVGGRFLNPLPRRRLFETLGDARPRLVASGHVHQFRATRVDGARHVWCPSTGFVLPDERQPTYGVKAVGYAEHRLAPDGSLDSRFVQVPGVPTLNIADFPQAYDHP